jgi:hypothetical protein
MEVSNCLMVIEKFSEKINNVYEYSVLLNLAISLMFVG